MPILCTMGLKKIWITPADETPGIMPENGEHWLDLGDVYKETCQLTDDDVEETLHESETSSKKITLCGEYVTGVQLTLMDPDMELLARYFGGKITGEKGKRKWWRPRKPEYKEWAIKLQPEEGLFIGCPNTRIIPKFEITYSSKGIALAPIKIKFQDQLCAEEGVDAPNVVPTPEENSGEDSEGETPTV